MTMLVIFLALLFLFTATFVLAEWLATGGSMRRPHLRQTSQNELPWRVEP